MTPIFFFCALIGGTVLICQFVLTLVGLGDPGFEITDDVPDSADVELSELDLSDGADGGDIDDGDLHGSSWLFGVISFRTLVAAATFFGLTGMAASTGGLPLPAQLMIAISCGMVAMFGVHWLMRSFYRLSQSGTLRVSNTIGKTGTVYIPIPEAGAGQGKVQLKVQDRLEEFPAINQSATSLSTGAKVVVVGVVNGNTVEVKPLHAPAEVEV